MPYLLLEIGVDLTVYMGWDSRETESYKVAEYSIKKFSPNVEVVPLIQSDLRKKMYYNRSKDEKTSTEFTFTRFLVPYLNKYKKWALFVDSDIVVTCPIEKIMEYADSEKALMCVEHNYSTTQSIKMDGMENKNFPRKNHSSVMLFNCSHPLNKQLNIRMVNTSTPAFLHQFKWLTEDYIGGLPIKFNFLVGEYQKPKDLPKIIHYTHGTPEFPGYENCDYAELWYQMRNEMNGIFPKPEPKSSWWNFGDFWDFFRLGIG